MNNDGARKAQTLVEALPYIQRFQGETIVVAPDASIAGAAERISNFAEDIALLKFVGLRPLVVCPGGRELNEWVAGGGSLCFDAQKSITSLGDTALVETVSAQRLQEEIVTAVNKNGARAISLSGRDASCILTDQRRDEHGYGSVLRIDAELLGGLGDDDCIPIISAVGIDKQGIAVPLRCDLTGAEIAIATLAYKLVYLGERERISSETGDIDFLELQDAEELLSKGVVSDAQGFQLSGAIRAIKKNVRDVHILSATTAHAILLELFTVSGIGTKVARLEPVCNIKG